MWQGLRTMTLLTLLYDNIPHCWMHQQRQRGRIQMTVSWDGRGIGLNVRVRVQGGLSGKHTPICVQTSAVVQSLLSLARL